MSGRSILILAGLLLSAGLVAILTNSVDIGSSDQVSEVEPAQYVWSVLPEDLNRMAIVLPTLGLAQAWVVGPDDLWHFDDPDGPTVDKRRWGSGIPLLLSGPAAGRAITDQATAQQLTSFGLSGPSMQIDLGLVGGESIAIDVGDPTPDRSGFYIRLRDSDEVYTVPESWYRVLERLVVDPPIQAAG